MKIRLLTVLFPIFLLICTLGLTACDKDEGGSTLVTEGGNAETEPVKGEENEFAAVSFLVEGKVFGTQAWNTPAVPAAVPEKTGYVFEGWYLDEGIWEQPLTASNAAELKIEQDTRAYAKFKVLTYPIIYELAGGTNGAGNPSFYTVEDAVSFAAPTKKGYRFDGWSAPDIQKGSTGERRLSALWTAEAYRVVYENTFGLTNAKNPVSFTVESGVITLGSLSREGYTFDGWYDGNKRVTELAGGTVGSVTLTARWTAHTYTVKFDANGGTGSMPSKTYTYDQRASLPEIGFTRKGYLFIGWKDGAGRYYPNKAAFQNLTATDKSETPAVTLTAQWYKEQSTASFGIDISYYQATVDFDILKNKANYLILRAGYTGYSTGVSKNIDTSFEDFYKKAKARGIPVGAYWYSCANTYEKGRAEAEFMYEHCLKGKTFELPIYIDIEESRYHQVGKRAVAEAIHGFCEYMISKNIYVGVYSSTYYFKNYIDTADIVGKYEIWLAHYGLATRPTFAFGDGAYGIWQNSDSFSLDGRRVDTNYCYRDYKGIVRTLGLNGFGAPILRKTSEELAREVLNGVWGSGADRKQALAEAGYDYSAVQAVVQTLLEDAERRK